MVDLEVGVVIRINVCYFLLYQYITWFNVGEGLGRRNESNLFIINQVLIGVVLEIFVWHGIEEKQNESMSVFYLEAEYFRTFFSLILMVI